ncbi:hypothetical protein Poli38472_014297 [Pythium oligandrum]|uniref:Uncharacterized protein n=1 Tax=Pythium oligandrum TaxID=41045 RepID=A0A8K1CJ45_PYTOL|nr:hypothetical protein Poli38472_014297 [Pythium oligandrum]|eukprot:TMW64180.1 hypothetical protein Poli38472_014297 [Pythium oligandrum]
MASTSSSASFGADDDELMLIPRAPQVAFRMHILLNPMEENEQEPEDDQQPQQQQPAKIPKKRGRKAFLPKMNNSERGKYYRAKRKAYSSVLAGDVEDLRATIRRLTEMRQIYHELAVSPRATSSGSLVKLVREYFVQFRHGVQLSPARRNMMLQDVETSTVNQLAFMRATMDPEVSFGEFKGIEVVMDQWERYSKFHAFLQFELLELKLTENETGYIVETSGQLRTRYGRTTIENVFPHVVGNEPLIQRLIGKEVVYPCRNHFYFAPDGRVLRYDVEADFPEALMKAAGSIQDAAVLLGEALIREQHMLGRLSADEMAILERKRVIESPRDVTEGHMDVDFLLNEQ